VRSRTYTICSGSFILEIVRADTHEQTPRDTTLVPDQVPINSSRRGPRVCWRKPASIRT
jgi:hypothetical protein